MRKVIDTAFIDQEFNGKIIKIFNPRLFGNDFSLLRERHNNNEVLAAATSNFNIYRIQQSSNINGLKDIRVLCFEIYCKNDLNKPVGFVNFDIFCNEPYIKLRFHLIEELFHNELALEIFAHLIVVLLYSLRKNECDKTLFCDLEQYVKYNPGFFLDVYIQQMFDLLLFERKYGKDKTISGVSVKALQKYLHNNKTILQRSMLSNSALPPGKIIMGPPDASLLFDRISPNSINRANINNSTISPENVKVEKRLFTNKICLI